MDLVSDFHVDITNQYFEELLNTVLKSMIELFKTFLEYLRSDSGPMSSYWMSYVDIVGILLSLVCSSHEGNWNLHWLAVS